MSGIIIELENVNEILSLLLRYVLPIVVLSVSTIVVVRLGIQRLSSRLKETKHEPLFYSNIMGLQEKWSGFWRWFTYKQNIAICAIAAVVFIVHLLYIANPLTLLGDEPYYVLQANRILHGQPLTLLEHPPLGNWIIAGGIFIFGDNAVGWRIFPIIFGIASIFIFYLICQTLVRRTSTFKLMPQNIQSTKWWKGWFQPTVFIPVLATFLFASDNLSFSQAHVAMLDVFFVTLMLLGFLFYLKGRYLLCGVAMGLSILCKETAVFGVFAIVLHWAITRRHEIANELRFILQAMQLKKTRNGESTEILPMASMIAAVLAVWFMLLPPLEYVKTPFWGNPFGRLFYIYWHNIALAPNSGWMFKLGSLVPSAPWEWLIKPNMQDYNLTHVPQYLMTIGWTIWAPVIPSIAFLGFKALKGGKNREDIVTFPLFWFASVYGSLILAELLTERPMYAFYFYPVIPAACLAIAWIAGEIWQAAQKKTGSKATFIIAISFLIIGSAVSFIVMSPLGTNLIKLTL